MMSVMTTTEYWDHWRVVYDRSHELESVCSCPHFSFGVGAGAVEACLAYRSFPTIGIGDQQGNCERAPVNLAPSI